MAQLRTGKTPNEPLGIVITKILDRNKDTGSDTGFPYASTHVELINCKHLSPPAAGPCPALLTAVLFTVVMAAVAVMVSLHALRVATPFHPWAPCPEVRY